MRLALSLLLVASGCAATQSVPPLSEAPGAKRLPTTDTGTSAPVVAPAKHRPRHRRPTSAVSRSLRRSVVGSLRTVTMYCYTGSRNAAGKWPTVGTAAGNAWPLGTRLYVESIGVVTVEDRSAPNATDVDLYGGSDSGCAARAAQFGRRLLHVSDVAA